MTLDEVPVRTVVTVAMLRMAPDEQRRLTELGLRHGARVEVLRRAPFGGPLALRVADGLLALRRCQAAGIVVAEQVTAPADASTTPSGAPAPREVPATSPIAGGQDV